MSLVHDIGTRNSDRMAQIVPKDCCDFDEARVRAHQLSTEYSEISLKIMRDTNLLSIPKS